LDADAVRMEVAVPRGAIKRWVATVHTDSTHPPKGLFTRSAAEIARSLASKKVSPKGPASGMRMLNYFINRAGRGLNARRKATLQKAKILLSERIAQGKKSRPRSKSADQQTKAA
jgi:tRNA(adenine34) deaminase